MNYQCHRCGEQVLEGAKVGRRDQCAKCSYDLRVCKNCEFYDRTAYNDCREPQAERVVEKERSNFCDYFRFSTRDVDGGDNDDSARKKLDDLFK